jgi:hypothetical protein
VIAAINNADMRDIILKSSILNASFDDTIYPDCRHYLPSCHPGTGDFSPRELPNLFRVVTAGHIHAQLTSMGGRTNRDAS